MPPAVGSLGMNNRQLADVMRPKTIDDIVGQEHLFGERGVIRRMLAGGRITNMIFYGPPGTGKTTAATVIAKESGMTFRRLNATTAALSDVKDVLSETEGMFGSGGILLYIDEIQYFNRKQQQSLLEYIEDGRVTLIASTTENPHFYIYNAVISRSSLFEFKPVEPRDTAKALRRAVDALNADTMQQKTCTDDTLIYIAKLAGGDVRRAIVLLENAYFVADGEITPADADNFGSGVVNFNDDTHYDLLSALQKSIRGSDPDAAVFYLMKLLKTGELLSAIRRLQVIAAEDIGLAYPSAIPIVRACCESARELGMPEAQIPLADAAILLATAPKSNSAYVALHRASEDIDAGLGAVPPVHLQSPLYKGYKYPHDFPGHYVAQDYLPDDIRKRGRKYYEFGENRTENAAREYGEKLKGKK